MSNVSEIMEQDIISINGNDSIQEALDVFRTIKIRHIPVMTYGILVGIISHSDIFNIDRIKRLLNEEPIDEDLDDSYLGNLKVQDLMISDPVTIASTEEVKTASSIFANSQFHALPVMEDNKLVGIVTSTDVIRYYLKEGS